MKKLIALALCAVMALGCFAGCDKVADVSKMAETANPSNIASEASKLVDQAQNAIPVPAKDRSGNDIKVPESVGTIISLAPSTTRVLVELGLGDKIVAIDTNSAAYADKLAKDVKQFDMMSPDNEAIAALKPDIVFTSGMSSVGGTSPFQSLVDAGICVADIPSPAALSDIAEDIKFIGACTGKGVEATAIGTAFDAGIKALSAAAAKVPEEKRKTVLFMMNIPSAEAPTIYSFGTGTYMDDMLTTIGAKNVCGDQQSWVSISVEDAIAKNPDVILTNANYTADPVAEIKALKGWENVTAVKEGNVYLVDNDLCSQPNNHVFEALIEWASDIYPDIKDEVKDLVKNAVK